MSVKKDKQKVLGEVFDDERIKSFLELVAPADMDADFHVLEKAYRGMGVDNFATFLDFFVQAGRNLSAKNPQGQALVDIVGEHSHGEAYKKALKKRLA